MADKKTDTKEKDKAPTWAWWILAIFSFLVFIGITIGTTKDKPQKLTKEAAVAQEWMICWDKTPEAIGFIPANRTKTSQVKIEKIDNVLVFRQFYEHNGTAQTVLFVGKKTAPLCYKGRWQQDAPAGGGEFFVRFTPDMKATSGWQDNGTKRAIPMQLFAKN